MKLDRLIQMLLPTDEKFFHLLDESAQNLMLAAEWLQKLPAAKTSAQLNAVIDKIRDLEHAGDAVTHKIFKELNSTFVTPIDREDIHQLASALDDVMDNIDGSVMRLTLYGIKKPPKPMAELVSILAKSIGMLAKGVTLLRDFKQFDEMQEVFLKINEYENDADRVFEKAVADLFMKEKRPVEIIKLKEVYVGLETATDKCEDAANVLEGILIKHA